MASRTLAGRAFQTLDALANRFSKGSFQDMEAHPRKNLLLLSIVPDPGRSVCPQARLKRTALEIPQQAVPLIKGSINGDWISRIR